MTQFSQKTREEARALAYQIQKLIQRYFYGVMLVMIILGILNSLGLWIIGIKYPFFWGFLGAILAKKQKYDEDRYRLITFFHKKYW